MAKINFYLKGAFTQEKTEKLKKDHPDLYQHYMNKPLPLILYVSLNGQRIAVPLGVSIPPFAWSGQRVKSTKECKKWAYINEIITQAELKTTQYCADVETKKIKLAKETLRFAVLNEKQKVTTNVITPTISELFKSYILNKRTNKGFNVARNTTKNYNSTLNHIEGYILSKGLKGLVTDINETFIENFKEYLYDKGSNDNTVEKYLKGLVTFLKYINENDYHIDSKILKYKGFEYEPPVIVVNLDEIKLLHQFDFEDEVLNKTRDLFIFMCFFGQRFSDTMKIKWEDLIKENGNDIVVLTTTKTKLPIRIPITPYAEDILKKYKGSPNPIPKFSSQHFNRQLKVMAKKAGLDRKVPVENRIKSEIDMKMLALHDVISSHIARKSFITNGLILGLSAEEVKTISGHKDDRSFRRYVNLAHSVVQKAKNVFSKQKIDELIDSSSC